MVLSWKYKNRVFSYITEEQLPEVVDVLHNPEAEKYLWFALITIEVFSAYCQPIIDGQKTALSKGEYPDSAVFTVSENGELFGTCGISRMFDGHNVAMNPYLFITKYSMHDMPMTSQAIKNAFKKYAALAKLNGEFSVHSLRHTCAVVRIGEGTPVVFVQKWLRHKSINSTMIYVDIASPELKKDEREASQTFDRFL